MTLNPSLYPSFSINFQGYDKKHFIYNFQLLFVINLENAEIRTCLWKNVGSCSFSRKGNKFNGNVWYIWQIKGTNNRRRKSMERDGPFTRNKFATEKRKRKSCSKRAGLGEIQFYRGPWWIGHEETRQGSSLRNSISR